MCSECWGVENGKLGVGLPDLPRILTHHIIVILSSYPYHIIIILSSYPYHITIILSSYHHHIIMSWGEIKECVGLRMGNYGPES